MATAFIADRTASLAWVEIGEPVSLHTQNTSGEHRQTLENRAISTLSQVTDWGSVEYLNIAGNGFREDVIPRCEVLKPCTQG